MKELLPRAEPQRLPVLALAFLSTGAALLVYVLFSLPLGLSLVFVFALVACLLALRMYRMDAARRAALVRQLGRGALAGMLATLAYDAVRLLIVELFDIPMSPFKAFPYFGYAIAGEHVAPSTAFAVGTLYHLANGLFFAVSYYLLLGGRRWFYGILWALGLELLMFSIYPTWLNLDAVLAEFTVVSVSGHLAYGSVLGLLARTSTRREA